MGVFNSFIWDEEFNLNVSRGKVRGASLLHKFGAVPAMSQNTTGTIWDVNDTIYPWSAFASAGTLTVNSDIADANKHIVIIGLDENYNEISEDLQLTSTSLSTTKSFIRVFRAYITNGSTGNVAAINVLKGASTVLRISAEQSQTLMAIYTIPAGKTGYLYKGVCSAQSSADGTGSMFVRYFGETAFRVGHTFEVSGSGGEYCYDFSFPIPIPEKSDIDVRMTTRSNNGRYTAAFDMLLVDNDI